jgi:ATP-binding cassette subfamily B protein
MERLRASNEWNFAGVIGQADGRLAVAWWGLLVLRGLPPALFAVAMGTLVSAVQRHGELAAPLTLAGTVFVLLQVLPSIHLATGANLGSRIAAWLHDQLTQACGRMADFIVVLDGARVVEQGTNEALLAKGGQYAELYGMQAAA